ncbi:unnamed protein product [Periconia digitata]|uniref:Uncharacterized protein n=1 Tax=Periconia digitata TaxID=1303443 RepID=A0A9W4UQ50_9PLEO|nr:unnamed protein product [Periconia digitata]
MGNPIFWNRPDLPVASRSREGEGKYNNHISVHPISGSPCLGAICFTTQANLTHTHPTRCNLHHALITFQSTASIPITNREPCSCILTH